MKINQTVCVKIGESTRRTGSTITARPDRVAFIMGRFEDDGYHQPVPHSNIWFDLTPEESIAHGTALIAAGEETRKRMLQDEMKRRSREKEERNRSVREAADGLTWAESTGDTKAIKSARFALDKAITAACRTAEEYYEMTRQVAEDLGVKAPQRQDQTAPLGDAFSLLLNSLNAYEQDSSHHSMFRAEAREALRSVERAWKLMAQNEAGDAKGTGYIIALPDFKVGQLHKFEPGKLPAPDRIGTEQ